jgi:hypothetical protein
MKALLNLSLVFTLSWILPPAALGAEVRREQTPWAPPHLSLQRICPAEDAAPPKTLPTVPSDCLTKAQKECGVKWAEEMETWEKNSNDCYYKELIGWDLTLCIRGAEIHRDKQMANIHTDYKKEIINCGGI